MPDSGGWTAHHILFARAGFTEAAQAEALAHGARLMDLATLERDLQGVS